MTGNWEVTETTGRIAYDELHINGFEYAFVAVAADQRETTIFDGLFAIHGSDIVFDPSLATPTTARFVLSGDDLTLTFTSITVTFRRKV
ncbi:MAG: hypothetical protein IPJ69_00375 [Deltaproteobacteria bacterium]|nr:MAG: hypothetical protein IPJ69_00375 [Deltaproteobacteria bacterium]